ncbi:hypothetical protein [Candidatus Enterovibrio altilux]|uniref:hypothetical protein n=1 Tax=Candidatus Enterovibrio altilux TaxID=1927128 RepID=UPI0016800C62|nr:hypothetical protein [Candidatus Enterovibrio luxaltus]
MEFEQLYNKKTELDLTRKEFADWLGLGKKGQKSVKQWEEGKEEIPQKYAKRLVTFPYILLICSVGKTNLKLCTYLQVLVVYVFHSKN